MTFNDPGLIFLGSGLSSAYLPMPVVIWLVAGALVW